MATNYSGIYYIVGNDMILVFISNVFGVGELEYNYDNYRIKIKLHSVKWRLNIFIILVEFSNFDTDSSLCVDDQKLKFYILKIEVQL